MEMEKQLMQTREISPSSRQPAAVPEEGRVTGKGGRALAHRDNQQGATKEAGGT